MRFADLDAVTIDAFGTLVELIDPVPALRSVLAEWGIDRSPHEVAEALAAEQRYYRAHLADGAEPESLSRLRVRCAQVFLDAAGAEVSAEQFEPRFLSALRFRLLDGVEPSLQAVQNRGLVLAVVANWDISLGDHLETLGLSRFFSLVEPLADKPRAEGLLRTLHRLGVAPARTLHVGDEEDDERAARSAGVHFRPAPLAAAIASLE